MRGEAKSSRWRRLEREAVRRCAAPTPCSCSGSGGEESWEESVARVAIAGGQREGLERHHVEGVVPGWKQAEAFEVVGGGRKRMVPPELPPPPPCPQPPTRLKAPSTASSSSTPASRGRARGVLFAGTVRNLCCT